MKALEKALIMLKTHPLCDHCLGRQFALLGYGLENEARGKSIKNALLMEAHASALSGEKEGLAVLRVLAVNGFLDSATDVLQRMGKQISRKNVAKKCFLCENSFQRIDELAEKAVKELSEYDFQNFLVGIELPFEV
ncbi:hypothetical protein H5T51_04410, partial [Candidatus Bathyarchaeota archaeon]|nr:hypothetical protein [Candidatus Bathyarchaeota archaeon]